MNIRLGQLSLVLSALGALAIPAVAHAGEYQCTFNISGTTSVDNQGYQGNSRLDVNLGPNATATAIGAAGTLTHYFNSWFCESRINFTGGSGSASFSLQPHNVCTYGTQAFNSPLALLPSPIATSSAGRLHLEFYETFNDFGGGGVDGVYESGSSITVAYTANSPGTCSVSVVGATTCASEGYTGTQLTWCQNICEKGYTGSTLATWLRRWINRYHDEPYCTAEGGEEPPPPPQEG